MLRFRSLFLRCLAFRPPLCFSEEIASALTNGRPIVALESTVITHGLPYPQNVETAKRLESAVRENGAVPATIAILDGDIRIGLEERELEQLASDTAAVKCSRRDIAAIVSRGKSGGTTVSGTMLLAHKAGIKVFATGGIGGVHRGADFDISADLTEMGKTPVCVVSAGIKSILDVPKTLEFLETEGCIVGTLKSPFFPAFWLPSSGIHSPMTFESIAEAAGIWKTQLDLNIDSGMLVAVPVEDVPEKDQEVIVAATEQALLDLKERGVTGNASTPFLLSRIKELTNGKSMAKNIDLLVRNAEVAAQLACLLEAPPTQEGSPVVVGGAFVDFTAQSTNRLDMRTSNPGRIAESYGGVGRNIAEAMARLGCRPTLLTAIGTDLSGAAMRKHFEGSGGNVISILQEEHSCGKCSAVLDSNGEMVLAVCDTESLDRITVDLLEVHRETIRGASIVILDGNLAPEVLEFIAHEAASSGVPVLFEPTSVPKAARIVMALGFVSFLTPNVDELKAIFCGIGGSPENATVHSMCEAVLDEMKDGQGTVAVTMGKDGIFCMNRKNGHRDILQLPSLVDPRDVVNTTGAGDCFTAAFASSLLVPGANFQDAVQRGLRASKSALNSSSAVPEDLSSIL